MTSQVIFKIDEKTKKRAMARARREGVALSSVLKAATRAFVAGDLDIGLTRGERLNAKTMKDLEEAVKDIKAGRNLSPTFDNVEDMIKYLESSDDKDKVKKKIR